MPIKLFVSGTQSVTVSDPGAEVLGTSGVQTVKLTAAATGVILNPEIERVEFSGALSAYTFNAVPGVGVQVFSGTTLVTTLATINQNVTLAFANGSAALVQTGGSAFTLGGAALTNSTTAAAITTATVNAGDVSTVAPVVVAAPTFSVVGATAAAEGASATFTVTLSAAQSTASTVTYTLAGTGGATLGTDTGTNVPAGNTGTLTFAAGVTTATVVVPFTADTTSPEAGEGVSFTLSAPSAGTALSATAATATTTITDVPVTYTLTASASNVFEGAAITYTLTASAASAVATSVDFSVVAGDTAAANQGTSNTNLNDFAAGAFNPTTVVIAAGATTATYVVTSSTDIITELPEGYSVRAVIGTTTVATRATTLLDGNGSGGQTYNLTTSPDSGAAFIGGGGNDAFSGAVVDSLSVFDSIDGGLGIDTLTANLTGAALPASLTVKGIETVTLVTTAAGFVADFTPFTGITSATVTSGTAGAVTLTAPITTAVTATGTGAGNVQINGGGVTASATTGAAGTIDIGKTGAFINAFTSITTSGGSTVSISDNKTAAANQGDGTTLTSVTISGAADDQTIKANALTTLNLTKLVGATTVGDTTVTAAAGTRALTINYNGVDVGGDGKATGGALAVTDGEATTVTINAVTAASYDTQVIAAKATSAVINSSVALQMTSLDLAAATTLTVGGAAATTIAAFATTNKLVTVTANGAGTFTADLSGQGTQLTTIDASASTGANNITINGTQKYTGGSGVDTVTAAVSPTVAVKGGAGTADVFVVNAKSFALTNVSEFETLGAGANADGVYSAAGFTGLTLGKVAAAVTFNNVAAGAGLTVTAAPTFATTYTLATDTAADVLNLTLRSAAAIDAGTINATTVETVNVTLVDSDTTKHIDTLALVSTSLKSVVITGNAGLNLTASDVTITSVDASAVTNTAGTKEGLVYTYAATPANAVNIKGTSTGGDTIDFGGAGGTKVLTVTAYAGTNTLKTAGGADVITGGTGVDTIDAGAGNDVIVGGGGADLITGGAGADRITVSGTTATIVQALLSSGGNTSNTIQTTELTSTFDVVFGAAAGLKINTGNADIASKATTGATLTLLLANTNLSGGVVANTDDSAVFVRGTYDALNGVFSYGAAGPDSVLTYDSDVGATITPVSIVLVGYVAGTATDVALGVITLG